MSRKTPNESSENEIPVSVWLDRFVSASTAPDVERALEGLLACSASIQPEDLVEDKNYDGSSLAAFIQVVQTSTYKNLDLEQGSVLATQIVAKWLNTTKGQEGEDTSWIAIKLLDHSLVAALVDVACQSNNNLYRSSLARVLALEQLERLAQHRATAKVTQTQLLQANGLVRLAELFSDTNDPAVPLSMLQLAQTLVEWPAVARNWMFVDVPSVLLKHFVKPSHSSPETKDDNDEYAVTTTTTTTIQALHILTRMLQQDASFALLFLETTTNLHVLLPCLDLRLASEYVNPQEKKRSTEIVGIGVTKDTRNYDDDLDALLQAPSSTTTTTTALSSSTVVKIPPPPQLLPSEQAVVMAVLDFLAVLMEQEMVRSLVWQKHEPLGRMIWDLALLTPPPTLPTPTSTLTEKIHLQQYYPCAMPNVDLQAQALLACAAYWNNAKWLPLDRLLYLACTGKGALVGINNTGGTVSQFQQQKDRFRLSTCAVHLLRATLTLEVAQELLLESRLSGAALDEDVISTPQPTAVQKLLFTVLEHLQHPTTSSGPTPLEDAQGDPSRPVFLLGATTALLVFLHNNEASKTLLLKIEPQLLPRLVETLHVESDPMIVNIVLHFLVHWIDEAPMVLQALLQLPDIPQIIAHLGAGGSSRKLQSFPLVWLLLGLALDQMLSKRMSSGADGVLAGGDSSGLEDWGGWTPTTIVETIKSYGMSRIIQALNDHQHLAWLVHCQPEELLHKEWYRVVVLQIRKRLVQAVVQQQNLQENENDGMQEEGRDGNVVWNSLKASSKSLSVLVEQQTVELEELRMQLADSRRMLSKQEQQLDAWKRRVESTPSQLDDMLSEYAMKNSDLEAQVSDLQDRLASTEQAMQQELKVRDEQNAQLQQDLSETQQDLVRTQQQRDSLRDELMGLSQAYSSLEDDFRRHQEQMQTSGSSMVASLQSQGEGSEEQAGGAGIGGSIGIGSTEIVALRADNNRLRHDVKAAEDWMAMAYDRMSALQQENTSLLAQVESARLVTTASQSNDSATVNVLCKEERNQQQLLQQKMLEVEKEKTRLLYELDQERGLRLDLEKKYNDDLQESRLKIESLTLSQNSSGKPTVDHATMSYALELQVIKEELHQSKERAQEEIYQREARIRELEARLDSGLGEYTLEDIKKRDGDIEKLKQANIAAQEWMTKAIEHNTNISKQVADLTQEKTELNAQIQKLMEKVASYEEAPPLSQLEEAESLLREQTTELQTLQSDLGLHDKHVKNDQSSNVAKVAALEASILQLKEQIDTQQEEASQAIAICQQQYNELLAEHQALKKEKKSWAALGVEVEKVSELEMTITSLREQLTNKEQEADQTIAGWQQSYNDLQHKLEKANEYLTANAVEAEKVSELETSIISLRERLESQEQEANQVIARWQQSYKDLLELHEEHEKEKVSWAACGVKGEQVSELELTIMSLQEQLENQDQEANQAIARWQQSYNDLLAQHQKLEKEKESLAANNVDEKVSDLEMTIISLREQLKNQDQEANQAITGWQQSYNDLQHELEKEKTSKSATFELEMTVVSLRKQFENQVQEANKAIARWQQSYNDLLSQHQELKKEKASWDELGVKVEKVSELEMTIASLREQLENQEQEANQAITGWQQSYNDLLTQHQKLEKEKASLAATSVEVEKVSELESLIISLREQLKNQEQETNQAITGWQQKYSELQQELEKEKELMAATTIEVEATILSLREQLENQEQEASQAITGWQKSYNDLLAQHQKLEKEKESLAATSVMAGKVSELETLIISLREQLKNQEQEANQTITGWQQNYNDLLAKHQEFKKEEESVTLNAVEHEKVSMLEVTILSLREQLEKQEQEAKQAITGWQQSYNDLLAQHQELKEERTVEAGSVNSLKTTIISLRDQLKNQEHEANQAIAGWQENYNDLLVQHQELEKEKESLAATAVDAEKVSEFNATIISLREQLENQENEATQAIAGWQQSYNDLLSQHQELKKEKESWDALGVKVEKVSELEMTIASLREQIDHNDNARRTLTDCQNRFDDIMAKYQELEREKALWMDKASEVKRKDQGVDQAKEVNQYIECWQQRYNDLLAQNVELEKEKADLLRELQCVNGELEHSMKVRMQCNESLEGNEQIESTLDFQSKIQHLERQLVEHDKSANEAINQWQDSLADSESRNQALEREIEALKQQLASHATNDMTDFHHPEVALSKATSRSLESSVPKGNIVDLSSMDSKAHEHEQPLAEQECSTDEVIMVLQESLSSSKAKIKELEEELKSENLHAELDVWNQLCEQEREANDVIAQWEDSYNTVTKRCEGLEMHVHNLEESIANLQKTAEEASSLFEVTLAEKDKECSELMQLLEVQKVELSRCKESSLTQDQVKNDLENTLRTLRHELETTNEQLKSRCQQLEDELSFLVDQADSYEGVIADRDRDLSEMQCRLDELQDSEEQLQLLEGEKMTLSATLQASEGEITRVKKKLEIMVAKAQYNLSQLAGKEMEHLMHGKSMDSTVMSLQENLERLESLVDISNEEAASLSQNVKTLYQEVTDLKLSCEDSKLALAHTQESLRERENEVSQLYAANRDAEATMNALRGQIEELVAKVHECKDELVAQEQDAHNAISEWELRYLELQEMLEMSRPNDKLVDELFVSLREELKQKLRLLSSIRDYVSIDTLSDSKESTLSMAQLKQELSKASNLLETAIRGMLSQLSASEGRCNDIKRQLEESSLKIARLEPTNAEKEDYVIESARQLQTFEHELEVTKPLNVEDSQQNSTTTSTQSSIMNESKGKNDELQKKLEMLTLENSRLEEETIRLRIIVQSLEEDMRTAEDALRLRIMNETSERAVDLVLETMQKQNDELQSQIEIIRSNLKAEKDARRAAESENSRLSSDLAVLLGMSDISESRPEIKVCAMEACEEFHQQEQEETEQLKDALTAALDELSVVNQLISEAEERASKSRLQASLYEQEIVTAKADLKLLAEKMDEMRDSESTKRESLEYRVTSLQNDNAALHRQHNADLERLQYELHHMSMEKDRLFQALKVSEHSKETLLRAKTGSDSPVSDDLFLELTKLRLEKAELLIAITEDGSRLECRLREARAAVIASTDADMLLEKELRVTAEKALESAEAELNELRAASNLWSLHSTDLEESITLSELHRELSDLKNKLLSVTSENRNLRDQLERVQIEDREQIEALRDDCRQAKARATQMEREGHIQAEIQAEVSRMRTRATGNANSLGSADHDPAEDDGEVRVEHYGMTLLQMSAMIQEQDRKIKESAAAYTTLASEHESLLAVLAELHNVRTSLKQALLQVAGQSAVEDALRTANEMTIALCKSSSSAGS